jgi:hypothetical protein
MRSHWSPSVEALPPIAGLVAVTYFVLLRALTGDVLSPDNEAYVAYASQWLNGWSYTHWTTPKPLEVVVLGTVYLLTGSLAAVGLVFDVAMGVLVYLSCRLANRIGRGTCCAPILILVSVAASPFFVDSTLTGGSGIIATVFVFAAFDRVLSRMDQGRPSTSPAVVVPLLPAGLSRPEHWLTAVFVGAALLLFRHRSLGRSHVGLAGLGVLVPCVAPLVWLVFDHALAGDAFYSSKVTRGYAENAAAVFSWSLSNGGLRFPMEVARFVNQDLSVTSMSLAAIGAAVLAREERWRSNRGAWLFVISTVATLAFYGAATLDGMVLFNRFFFLPYMVVVVLSAVGGSAVVSAVLRRADRAWRTPLAIVAAVLILAGLVAPGVSQARSLWRRYAAVTAQKAFTDSSALTMSADAEFLEDGYLVVPARSVGRYHLRLSVDGARVFTLRQLAALAGTPLFETSVVGLMQVMEPQRRGLIEHQTIQLQDAQAVGDRRRVVTYVVHARVPSSSAIDHVVETVRLQSSAFVRLSSEGSQTLYRAVTDSR